MNTKAVTAWLDQMLRRREGLREIDPEMHVPWTPLQWLLALAVTVVVLTLLRQIYRWLSDRWTSSRRDFLTLIRELDGLDEARLQRRKSHSQVVTTAAELLREGLRMADREKNGSRLYRTSAEWVQWSRQEDHDHGIHQRIQEVLRLHDRLLYLDQPPSLDDARKAVTDSRQVLLELSRSAAEPSRAKPTAKPAKRLSTEQLA